MMMAYANSSNSGGSGEGDITPEGVMLPLYMNTYQLGEPTWEITYGLDISCNYPLPCDVELEICFDEEEYADGPYYTEWITLEAGKTAWNFAFTFANNALRPQMVYASAKNMNILGDRKDCPIIPTCLWMRHMSHSDGVEYYFTLEIAPVIIEQLESWANNPDKLELPIVAITAGGIGSEFDRSFHSAQLFFHQIIVLNFSGALAHVNSEEVIINVSGGHSGGSGV
jgi:hypothetical protein